jgi:hypothetical protein
VATSNPITNKNDPIMDSQSVNSNSANIVFGPTDF